MTDPFYEASRLIKELRDENARLRKELNSLKQTSGPSVPEGFAIINVEKFAALINRDDWRNATNRAELRAMLAAGKEES